MSMYGVTIQPDPRQIIYIYIYLYIKLLPKGEMASAAFCGLQFSNMSHIESKKAVHVL